MAVIGSERPLVPRSFIVGRDGVRVVSHDEHLRHMGVSPSLSAAWDLLSDAGADMDNLGPLLLAAERQGKDPETFARHIMKLSRALRG